MQPETRVWLDGLRAWLVERRSADTDAVAPDPAATRAERMILAAHVATWLDESPALLRARRDFAGSAGSGVDPDPALVLTTSPPGLEVAEDLFAGDSLLAQDLRARVVCATEREYRAWCMRHPDADHRLHVNHWNWIKTQVPPRREREFRAHPLRAGERYWLHRTGTAGAGSADGRDAHLWRFDGRHATLLQAFVHEAGTRPPRAGGSP